jgi:hypothetical protein
LQPARRELVFQVDQPGTCNAVATWFELDLLGDGRHCVTTSPHTYVAAAVCAASAGSSDAATQRRPQAAALGAGAVPVYATSWRQAVHPMPHECRVRKGEALMVAASHDSYGVSFGYTGDHTAAAAGVGAGGGSIGAAQEQSGAPYLHRDSAWAQRLAQVRALEAGLGRQAAQQPRRHAAVVRAVTALAAQPVSLEADAAQAVAMCARMML